MISNKKKWIVMNPFDAEWRNTTHLVDRMANWCIGGRWFIFTFFFLLYSSSKTQSHEKRFIGLEWTTSHQCTSWSFFPMDGLHFFIRHQIGFITVHFFLLLTIVLFFFGLFLVFFPLNLTSHISTLFTFLPS